MSNMTFVFLNVLKHFVYFFFSRFLRKIADSLVSLLKSGADRDPEIIEQVSSVNHLEWYYISYVLIFKLRMSRSLKSPSFQHADIYVLVIYYDASAKVSCAWCCFCSQVSKVEQISWHLLLCLKCLISDVWALKYNSFVNICYYVK